ncbi:DUF262 domain-containing HNH endonuclease family protein [Streptomyces olivaceus]|uniref:DUF262 domain-containing HNH endonuclease family protein n=1 Tax=Streptomyces olivaceus TaxID=47716 RepID=A0ABS7W2U5_STROV|nr:DUF262 domain-containing protein [Streptomyces olivaceus]MBZ6088946.1 DUF262 domain-containing HNH endonuclease family protein [Streptomyces olivaceus]MBZ6095680.1 DUF262 domain-containing HNH endonuclease family protein [Streptomyces olivaceus]MBZ6119949.1 DUF262 domain-containing HNH endonuclease family protein [Streptomyces olivaceus]MBZ6151500.1 DUF262 domain-containing HNH endonuclease family protein [Streptomyces olivaceus]MBZ6298378.1 DUF262 domain-containing HNH endonuclease family 
MKRGSELAFDAIQRTIGEIILIGEHVIPRYQRPYAWDEENVFDLWNDLKDNPEGHFLGNMVVHPSGSDSWDLVDGQQRLTTVLIAIRAIKDAYEKIGEKGRAQGLFNYLQRVDLSGDPTFRLKYRTESGFLHLSLFSEPESKIRQTNPKSNADKAQYSAYKIFARNIEAEVDKSRGPDVETIDAIRDRFIRSTVVYVRVDDRQDAFRIFETLNDRGKSLNQVDLVKNQVISSIPVTAAQEEERLWVKSVSQIESISWSKVKVEDFLGYLWNSTSHQQDDEIVAVNRIRRSVDAYMRSKANAEQGARDFIRLFSETAEIFKEFDECLASPNGKHWADLVPAERWRPDRYASVDHSLYGCLVPGSNLPLNLLFSLLRNYIHGTRRTLSNARLVDFLRAIENLQFRWSISQRPSTSTIRRAYRRAAYSVDSASTANDIVKALQQFKRDANSLMPTDAQFKDGLKKLTYFTQRPQDVHRVRHTLERIEEFWGSSRLSRNQVVTLEHIEPQGAKSINSNQNFWVGKLGNLMLLPMEVNSALPSAFSGKAPKLAQWANSKDLILQKQIEVGAWGNAVANRRMEELLDAAISVWPKVMTI